MIDLLHSSANGLTTAEATARTKSPSHRQGHVPIAVELFLRQLKSPPVLILVVGAVLALLLREWIDATIILAIVLGSGVLGLDYTTRPSFWPTF